VVELGLKNWLSLTAQNVVLLIYPTVHVHPRVHINLPESVFKNEFIYIYIPTTRTLQIQRDRRVTVH